METFIPGMLTITDFINILRKYHNSGQDVDAKLEEDNIETWKNDDRFIANDIIEPMQTPQTGTQTGEVLKRDNNPFLCIDVQESLFTAVELLCNNKVHRLPVYNQQTGNVLYILTHKRILRFLSLYMNDISHPAFMAKPPKELGIGTWNNIQTVTARTRLFEVLNLFAENRISALPVLNDEEQVVDIYAKFDVITLAAEKAYENLNIPLETVLGRREYFEGVQSCHESDSLLVVIDNLVKAEVHRMIITDEDMHVKGILSLSDILRFMVLVAPNLPANDLSPSASGHSSGPTAVFTTGRPEQTSTETS